MKGVNLSNAIAALRFRGRARPIAPEIGRHALAAGVAGGVVGRAERIGHTVAV